MVGFVENTARRHTTRTSRKKKQINRRERPTSGGGFDQDLKSGDVAHSRGRPGRTRAVANSARKQICCDLPEMTSQRQMVGRGYLIYISVHRGVWLSAAAEQGSRQRP